MLLWWGMGCERAWAVVWTVVSVVGVGVGVVVVVAVLAAFLLAFLFLSPHSPLFNATTPPPRDQIQSDPRARLPAGGCYGLLECPVVTVVLSVTTTLTRRLVLSSPVVASSLRRSPGDVQILLAMCTTFSRCDDTTATLCSARLDRSQRLVARQFLARRRACVGFALLHAGILGCLANETNRVIDFLTLPLSFSSPRMNPGRRGGRTKTRVYDPTDKEFAHQGCIHGLAMALRACFAVRLVSLWRAIAIAQNE